jgi:hypothetical protein
MQQAVVEKEKSVHAFEGFNTIAQVSTALDIKNLTLNFGVHAKHVYQWVGTSTGGANIEIAEGNEAGRARRRRCGEGREPQRFGRKPTRR